MTEETHLLTETHGAVAVIRMNRPKVLNALNLELMKSLAQLMEKFDEDDSIKVILLAGTERAWAAGADIGDMAEASVSDMAQRDQFAQWERIKRIKKPIVAAVSGFALGGGCELMMHCDVIICSETARIRPARDKHRRHARGRRNTASHSGHRQGGRHGCRPFGPLPVCPGGARLRSGQSSRPEGTLVP